MLVDQESRFFGPVYVISFCVKKKGVKSLNVFEVAPDENVNLCECLFLDWSQVVGEVD